MVKLTHEYMLYCILEWAKDNPQFDASTMEGIDDYLDSNELTLEQEIAIENVFYGWKVPEL